MARMYFYVITALAITMLLYITGITTQNQGGVLEETGFNDIIAGDLNSNSSFFSFLFAQNVGILLVGLLGGIAVTFFAKSPTENYLILPFITTVLALFVGAFWNILIISSPYPNWVRIPLILFVGPFTIGYILTMVEFFRGNV